MSNKQKAKSEEGQEFLAGLSVYDFLYQDVRRVGSLLAQFEPSGLLQSIKHTQGYSELAQSSSNLKPSISVVAAKIEGAVDQTAAHGNSESAERAYDPLWVNALSLLAYLQNNNILVRDLETARLGQIVLASGSLQVFDMSTLQRMWAEPKFLQQVLANLGEKSSTAKQDIQKKSGVMKLLSLMPHPVQALLTTGDKQFWTVLNEPSLEVSASSLFLKYGTEVEGDWNILGVLDAFPDSPNAKSGQQSNSAPDNMMELMVLLNDLARRIGRPAKAYGMTPLLIFRQIAASE